MNTTTPLTVSDVLALQTVVEACIHCHQVAVVLEHGDIFYGIARSICSGPQQGMLRTGQDIRDGHVWITGRGGFEHWFPVAELADKAKTGEFVAGPEIW